MSWKKFDDSFTNKDNTEKNSKLLMSILMVYEPSER